MKYDDTEVRNIREFLEWTEKSSFTTIIGENGKPFSLEQQKVYYRGQSKKEWDLISSIFRETKLDEFKILREASLKLWSETTNCSTYLEKLVSFQHYGLKTRLLDVTFNPFIALYMACEDEQRKNEDGVVYCGYSWEHSNITVIEQTVKYLFLNSSNTLFNYESFAQNEKMDINLFTQPQFVYPPINNPRIEAQNGAFVMAPLVKKIGKDDYEYNRCNLNDSGFFDKKRAVINKKCKDEILHQLSLLGINVGTIYKGISEKIQAIMQEERWRTLIKGK